MSAGLSIRSAASWIAVGGLLLAVAGCGDGGPARSPVEGAVRFRDRPVAEASVTFHPLGPAAEGLPRPVAVTDAEGRFVVTTLKQGDGAPPGEYAVTVTRPALIVQGEEQVRNGPNQLPTKYAESGSTPLRATVAEGPTVLEPFTLE